MVNPRHSFKTGDIVYHARFGFGVIEEEWGSWLDVDEKGNEVPVNGASVYEVRFENGKTRSINRCWLALGPRAASSGAKPVWPAGTVT